MLTCIRVLRLIWLLLYYCCTVSSHPYPGLWCICMRQRDRCLQFCNY